MADDIYGDLEQFNLGDKITELQEQNDELNTKIDQLSTTAENLRKQVHDLSKMQEVLKRNISSLYFTAKTEIERKDRTIADLRRQLDDLLFRRISPSSLIANNGAPQGMKRKETAEPCDRSPKRRKENDNSNSTKNNDYKRDRSDAPTRGYNRRRTDGRRDDRNVRRRSKSREPSSRSHSDKTINSRSRSSSYDSRRNPIHGRRRTPESRRYERNDRSREENRNRSRNSSRRSEEKRGDASRKRTDERSRENQTNDVDKELLALEMEKAVINKKLNDIDEESIDNIALEVEKTDPTCKFVATAAAVIEKFEPGIPHSQPNVEKSIPEDIKIKLEVKNEPVTNETGSSVENGTSSFSPQQNSSDSIILTARRRRRCVITVTDAS